MIMNFALCFAMNRLIERFVEKVIKSILVSQTSSTDHYSSLYANDNKAYKLFNYENYVYKEHNDFYIYSSFFCDLIGIESEAFQCL
jgi:hypothetical protein